jgi:hypothetical protein
MGFDYKNYKIYCGLTIYVNLIEKVKIITAASSLTNRAGCS